MRNRLLATVAVAAVVGFGGFAAAQSQMGGESNKATPGATSGKTQEKSGGSMSGTQSGNKTLSPSSSQSINPSRNQSAQEKSGKDNERLAPQVYEKQQHKLKRLVQSPNSFFMDVKCHGCYTITTVFSHAASVVFCPQCSTVLCQPTGGKARLTEGCSYRRKVD